MEIVLGNVNVTDRDREIESQRDREIKGHREGPERQRQGKIMTERQINKARIETEG